MKATMYRLVVGEIGSERGNVINTKAASLQGAKIALGRALAKYCGDGWGRIEERSVYNGEWFTVSY